MSTGTPLTYYGGKQGLADRIVDLMPAHRHYLEPFAGGAAVLFAKPRAERESLNDADGTIMRFWRALRERPAELADAIAGTPYSRGEWDASRGLAHDDVEAARRLLVNVHQSFSRSRQSWSAASFTNNRWQPHTWAALPPRLLAAATRLKGVLLEQGDGVRLIERWDVPEALIYADPPYVGPHRLRPAHGYDVDARAELWPELVETLAGLRHAMVILSGYPCAETDALGWRSISWPQLNRVRAQQGDSTARAPETVWLSPNMPEPQPSLFEARHL